ncbi:hypothetical protein WJX84_011751, partial [Apatococcus fuscideae]
VASQLDGLLQSLGPESLGQEQAQGQSAPQEDNMKPAAISQSSATGPSQDASHQLSPASIAVEAGWQTPPWMQEASFVSSQQITVGNFETSGQRGDDRMEDASAISSPLDEALPHCHLLAVFDGHAGAAAARHAAAHIRSQLYSHWGCATAEAALTGTFEILDRDFRAHHHRKLAAEGARPSVAAAKSRTCPGACALAALICGSTLHIANAGDCRAVLCSQGEAVQLSTDHTADVIAERDRIKASGGLLYQVAGGWRIGRAGIQVSRSLGDAELKADGLISAPEVTQRLLTEADEFLILASDGLWERMSNEQACGLVHDTVKEAGMAAKRLATEALARGSGDNITVVVAFLQPVSTLEQIYRKGRASRPAAATFHGTRGKGPPMPGPMYSADEMQETL